MSTSALQTIADRSRLRQLVQPVAIALAFLLLVLLFRSQWDSLKALEWHIRPAWLALSGLCIVGGWLIEVALWCRLVAILGGRIAYLRSVQLWFASAIVRYIPGNIWQPLSLTVRCRAEGVRAETTLASLSLFHVVQLLAVAPIAAAFVATSGAAATLTAWSETFSLWWALPLAVPILVFVFWPHGLIALANMLLGVAGRDPLPLELTRSELVILLGISLAGWLLFSTAFTSLAIALLPPSATLGDRLPVLMAAYPMAFAI